MGSARENQKETPGKRSRSRFSLLSLLPARHPPLIVPHSPTIPSHHLHQVPSRQPTLVSLDGSALSSLHSAYPDSTTPSPAGRTLRIEEEDAAQEDTRKYSFASYYFSTPSARVWEKPDHEQPPLPPMPLPHHKSTKPEPTRGGKGQGGIDPSPLPLPLALVNSDSSDSSRRSRTKRPPPLDLTRTRAVYPKLHGVIPVVVTPKASTSPPLKHTATLSRLTGDQGAEGGAVKKGKKEGKKVPVKPKPSIKDDPFDVVEIEDGHKYTSWKGGRVSIKPGQVIPKGTLPTLNSSPTIRGQDPNLIKLPPATGYRGRGEFYNKRGESSTQPNGPGTYLTPSGGGADTYHNILLTPSYFQRSPTSQFTASPGTAGDDWLLAKSGLRRKTLLDAIKRGSKWLVPAYDAARSRAQGKEDREMSNVKSAMKPYKLKSIENLRGGEGRTGNVRFDGAGMGGDSAGWSSGKSPNVYGSNGAYSRRSPGLREFQIGDYSDGKLDKEHSGKERRGKKREDEKAKKRRKMWRLLILALVILISALTIGLCTTLLTRKAKSSSDTPAAADSDSPSNSPTPTGTTATPTGVPSRTLATCLDLFATSASTSPLTYPCGDCVSLMSGVTNDFAQPLVDGNSTGVGSALQFCALMDIFRDAIGQGLGDKGWAKDSSPCGWDGVKCDGRGRVTELQLRYPDIPTKIPATISNMISLSSLRLMGNNTSPSGPLPSSILALPNITTIDIEYTALSGPVGQMNFAKSTNLATLVLVNNAQLGTDLPGLANNGQLKTLVITGQGIDSVSEFTLPSSLTYLDLSYNALNGQIPALTSLGSLDTLYLTNNNFTQPPSSLPVSVATLFLTANPGLSGAMPPSVCSSTTLASCDLRDTKLTGPINSTSSSGSSSSSGTASSSSSAAAASGSANVGLGAIGAVANGALASVCGKCQFS